MANVIRYRLRSDTGENWTSKNPVLLRGEPGFDETERRFKMGDGVKKWSELPYEAPDVLNVLNSDRVDAALSAAQGKALKLIVDAKANKNEIPAPVPIINDLTTGGANKALSAEQGKALKELIGASGALNKVRLCSYEFNILASTPSWFWVPENVFYIFFSGVGGGGACSKENLGDRIIPGWSGGWCMNTSVKVTPGDKIEMRHEQLPNSHAPSAGGGGGRGLDVVMTVNNVEVIRLSGGDSGYSYAGNQTGQVKFNRDYTTDYGLYEYSVHPDNCPVYDTVSGNLVGRAWAPCSTPFAPIGQGQAHESDHTYRNYGCMIAQWVAPLDA